VAVIASLLTAIYMFRLVFLTFHGERADAGAHGSPAGVSHAGSGHDHAGGGGHLHDAPPAMAVVLILLAVGAVFAGYLGVPAVLGGGNHIEHFLEPSFRAPGVEHGAEASESPAEARAEMVLGREATGEGGLAHSGEGGHAAPASEGAHDDHATELGLMAFSSGIALAGIGIAAYFFLRRKAAADRVAARFAGAHRVLLNKYYVDELYDAAIVQPIKRTSERALWRVFDAGVIDGAVNGAGSFVNGASAILRRLQTGSMRAYALSVFVGVVLILGYYVWR
jgi:NADH-quinone oxidoreductase subunit L